MAATKKKKHGRNECVLRLLWFLGFPFAKYQKTVLKHDQFYLQGTETEHINLKVLGQDNAVVQFKIKKHTPLRKLMNAYCDRAVSKYLDFLKVESILKRNFLFKQGLSMQVVRFRFDGQPINENDTPTSLEMEEGDTIEVYQQQTGGNAQ